jgi:hypothetical protein
MTSAKMSSESGIDYGPVFVLRLTLEPDRPNR